MAVALRGGSTAALASPGTIGASAFSSPTGGLGISAAAISPEGPGLAAGIGGGSPGVAGGAAGAAGDGGLESSLAQEQEMNLYYLQIQEQVNAQNRTFTALSNVLEVEHNTAKAAIGNIH